MSLRNREDSIQGIRRREGQATKVAASAALVDGAVALTFHQEETTVCTGCTVKFPAPCDCAAVTGGITINGETYQVVDSMQNCVTGKGGAWTSGAEIALVLDCENKKAYLQGATAAGGFTEMETSIPTPDRKPGHLYALVLADFEEVTG